MKHIALITGITGQDGSFLAEFLLEKGYEVHGTIRRSSVDYRERIAHLEGTPNFHLHYADLSDSMSIMQIIGKIRPTEVYNLAAQSHVQVSFDAPEFTADVDATGVLRVLEAVRRQLVHGNDLWDLLIVQIVPPAQRSSPSRDGYEPTDYTGRRRKHNT